MQLMLSLREDIMALTGNELRHEKCGGSACYEILSQTIETRFVSTILNERWREY